jgi:hypothetical protein
VRDLGWIMPTAWALRGLEAATWQGAGIGRAALCAAVVYAYSFVFLVVAMAFLTRRPAGRQPRGIP